MTMDAFYTPKELAAAMADAVTLVPDIVADVCAGDGALLRAARERWPSCAIVAVDKSKASVRRITKWCTDALAGSCDFLDSDARAACEPLKQAHGLVSVILINPPFSCRGGMKRSVSINGQRTFASLALSFVVEAFQYLMAGGQLVALLPAGSLTSEKDEVVWNILRSTAQVEVLSWHNRRTFAICSPRTVLVRISRRVYKEVSSPEASLTEQRATPDVRIRFYRGHRPIYLHQQVRRGGIPLLHSTELTGGVILPTSRKVAKRDMDLIGPALLLPRVGAPRIDKMAILRTGQAVSLSDCVLALCGANEGECILLKEILKQNFDLLRQLYGGTGAPYITVKQLTGLLLRLGFDVACHDKAARQLRINVEAVARNTTRLHVEPREMFLDEQGVTRTRSVGSPRVQ